MAKMIIWDCYPYNPKKIRCDGDLGGENGPMPFQEGF